MLHDADLLNSSFNCCTEPFHFTLRIFRFLLRNGADFHTWFEHVGSAAAETRRRGEALQSSAPALVGAGRAIAASALVGAQLAQGLNHTFVIFLAFLLFTPQR